MSERKYSSIDEHEIDQLLGHADSDTDTLSVSPSVRHRRRTSSDGKHHGRPHRGSSAGDEDFNDVDEEDALASSSSDDDNFIEQLEADVQMYSSAPHATPNKSSTTAGSRQSPHDAKALGSATASNAVARSVAREPRRGSENTDPHRRAHLEGVANAMSLVAHHPGALRLARISKEAEELLADSDSDSDDFEAAIELVLKEYAGAAAHHAVMSAPPLDSNAPAVTSPDGSAPPSAPVEQLASVEMREIDRLLAEAAEAAALDADTDTEAPGLPANPKVDAGGNVVDAAEPHFRALSSDTDSASADAIIEQRDKVLQPPGVEVRSASELVKAVSAASQEREATKGASTAAPLRSNCMADVLATARAQHKDLEDTTVQVEVMRKISTQLRRFRAGSRPGRKSDDSARLGSPGIATALAVCEQLVFVGTSRGVVLVFSHEGGLKLVLGQTPDNPLAAADGGVTSLDATDASGYLAAGFESGKVVLWDLTKSAAEVKVNKRNHAGYPVVYVRFFRHDAHDLGLLSIDASGGAFLSRYSRNLMFFWKAEDAPFLRSNGPHGQVFGIGLLSYSNPTAKQLPHVLRDRSRALALAAFTTSNGGSSAVVSLNQPSRVLLKWPLPGAEATVDTVHHSHQRNDGAVRRRVHHSWTWVDLHKAKLGASGLAGSPTGTQARETGSEESPDPSRDVIAVLARSCDHIVEFCVVTFPGKSAPEDDGSWGVDFDIAGKSQSLHTWGRFDAPSEVLALQWLGTSSLTLLLVSLLVLNALWRASKCSVSSFYYVGVGYSPTGCACSMCSSEQFVRPSNSQIRRQCERLFTLWQTTRQNPRTLFRGYGNIGKTSHQPKWLLAGARPEAPSKTRSVWLQRMLPSAPRPVQPPPWRAELVLERENLALRALGLVPPRRQERFATRCTCCPRSVSCWRNHKTGKSRSRIS